jgi:hypothetical protein
METRNEKILRMKIKIKKQKDYGNRKEMKFQTNIEKE